MMYRILGYLILITVILYVEYTDRCQSADSSFDRAQIILQVPYGIKNSSILGSTGLLVQGSRVTAMFLVESYHPQRLTTHLDIQIPKPLKPETDLEGVEILERENFYLLHAEFDLVTEFDDWFRMLTIQVPADTLPGNYSIHATAELRATDTGEEDSFEVQQQAIARVAEPSEIMRLLTVDRFMIPADSEGKSDKKYAKNSILLRSDLGFWGTVFGELPENDMAPVSYVGIQMSNLADENAIVLVSWEVLDPITGREIQAFRVPEDFLDLHGWGDNRIFTQVFIKGKGQSEFVLPIFADKDKVLPGHYIGRVTSRLFGSDVIVQSSDFDLTVCKMTWSSVLVTLYAICVALGISIFLITRNRIFFTRFKTRWLILIALFGAVKFLASLIPRFFLSELFNGLLGPFAVFATGFFREISCLFVMALVVLIPLPGVVTLSMLMSVVLFCLMGNFNLIVVLFMMVSMTTMEIALYLTGFTRNPEPDFMTGKRPLILAGLGMGAASAVSTFVDYNLYTLLYRLYYAKWYVLANIFVVGFFYTAIFAPVGVLLGNKLNRVAME